LSIGLFHFSDFKYNRRYGISLVLPDKRLHDRYFELIQGPMHHTQATASGAAVPAHVAHSFAVTQATWRFHANERVTPHALVEPLRQFAHEQIGTAPYTLAIIDWSKIDYKKHTTKHDIVRISHKEDIGYELTTQLLVETQTGSPIAAIQTNAFENCSRLSFDSKRCPARQYASSRTSLADDA
jgi:hypothetical protein